MTRTIGLSDNAGGGLALVAGLAIVVTVYIGSMPDDFPRWVLVLSGGIGVGAMFFERWLGIRDASTARVAKDIKPELKQDRSPAAEQLTGAGPGGTA